MSPLFKNNTPAVPQATSAYISTQQYADHQATVAADGLTGTIEKNHLQPRLFLNAMAV